LRKGYIRPSKSPQTSPVFFVDKKDGSKRMVMDYCNLNVSQKVTTKIVSWRYNKISVQMNYINSWTLVSK